MKKNFALIPVIALTLTACGGEKYTTDYLYKNPAKRHEVLKACAENKESNDNCVNANTAQATVTLEINNKKNKIATLQHTAQRNAAIEARWHSNIGKEQNAQKAQALQAQILKETEELNAMIAAQQAK